ncbi:hypothetical protein ACSLNL_27175, partial [Escherichia coli]
CSFREARLFLTAFSASIREITGFILITPDERRGEGERFRIGEINSEITTLQDMPLSLNDYCSFIPEYIERFGQEEYQSFKLA